MKVYLVSLGLGLLVGIIYALFNVRSPAPPVIALVGLLGILAGEQIPPLVKRLLSDEATRTSWLHQQVKPHMFGELPSCPKPPANPAQSTPDACGDKRNA
ncbi:XapX domain-containing protein [Achromobacter marplatensis]|uniref:XapX domain-containing protein n=1 Tax=Achromobacter marplatensis TaxID=470868 RepID=UPI0039F695A6